MNQFSWKMISRFYRGMTSSVSIVPFQTIDQVPLESRLTSSLSQTCSLSLCTYRSCIYVFIHRWISTSMYVCMFTLFIDLFVGLQSILVTILFQRWTLLMKLWGLLWREQIAVFSVQSSSYFGYSRLWFDFSYIKATNFCSLLFKK